MAKAAFIDLRENEVAVYASANGAGALQRVSSVVRKEGVPLALEGLPESGDVFLSLPLNLLDVRILDLPFSDREKIRELLPFELDGLVLDGSGEIVFDAHVLSRGEGSARVLVAYVRKAMLREVLRTLKEAGADPRVVTSIELARLAGGPEEGIAAALLEPPAMTEEERIARMQQELKAPAFDFRRGEFAYTADTEKAKKSLRLTAVLAALLIAVVSAHALLNIVVASRQIASLRDGMRKSYLALFPGSKNVSNELYQLKAQMKTLKEKETAFVGAPPLPTLLEIARAGRPGVMLSEVTIDRDSIVMKGECPSVADAEKFRTALEQAIPGLSVAETKPAAAQGKTLFTLLARRNRS